jgi:hypothetical protein
MGFHPGPKTQPIFGLGWTVGLLGFSKVSTQQGSKAKKAKKKKKEEERRRRHLKSSSHHINDLIPNAITKFSQYYYLPISSMPRSQKNSVQIRI